MSQKRIYLSSTSADRFSLNDTRNDLVSFDLNQPIICRSNQRMYLSLETMAFSNTMYNITSDTNTLIIDAIIMVIPTGQYATAAELRTAIQILLTGSFGSNLTITYSTLLNNFSIQNSSATIDYIINKDSTIGNRIGLSQNIHSNLTRATTVMFPRQVDVSNGRTLNFSIQNLEFNAVDSNGSANRSSILGTVPISSKFGEIQTYNNPRNSKFLINTKNITYLDIALIDLDNNAFNMGGLRWSAVILVTIE